MTALAPAVESFFTGYLTAQRGASPHTIASYRDTFRLLFTWIREQAGTRPSDLDFSDVDAATVTRFLAMLEDERHNTDRTRSQRLAAIHSLFRHAALGHPEHAALIARVLAIQPRKPARKPVAWLAGNEADALLAAPDPGTWTGRRDRLLMLLMLTSGARVSEITALTWDDLSLTRPGAHVLWHGKGRKDRLTPLRPAAIAGLRQWQRENPPAPGRLVFTARGTTRKMSTDAVAERIKIHAAAAAATCPGIAAKHVTPHVLRHSFAMGLQGRGVASDATFGRSREHALPAAQRTALWRAQRAGRPRGCGDLGRHRPPGSGATMMHLMSLRGMHHHCVSCHQGASGAPWLQEMHHHRSRRPAPCRR
jgi:integrase/recombinase XerD